MEPHDNSAGDHRTLSLLAQLAQAATGSLPPPAIWQRSDKLLHDLMGHKLFTVLAYAGDTALVTRVYSNHPVDYPVSGTKAMGPTPWGQRLLIEGKPYIGRNADDIRWAFPDHELILGLGCESTLNLPLCIEGRVLGTLNLLDIADHYNESHLPTGVIAAALLAPVMRQWLLDTD